VDDRREKSSGAGCSGEHAQLVRADCAGEGVAGYEAVELGGAELAQAAGLGALRRPGVR
jgi:hypothetical protein